MSEHQAFKQGNISIDAQNIMPVIKRWLYSDKDIFIRELVSNGVDAISKYRMMGKGGDEDLRVTVTVDKEAGIISFTDNGIGMTAEEVDRYINQVAFSSAEEFLKNYTAGDQSGIIGHFGLGFYSSFMAASKVTIDTLSWQENAAPVLWESEDGMAFSMSEGERQTRGTTITLTISEEEKEFLDGFRTREVLNRYCGYMSVPIYFVDIEAEKRPRMSPPRSTRIPTASCLTPLRIRCSGCISMWIIPLISRAFSTSPASSATWPDRRARSSCLTARSSSPTTSRK